MSSFEAERDKRSGQEKRQCLGRQTILRLSLKAAAALPAGPTLPVLVIQPLQPEAEPAGVHLRSFTYLVERYKRLARFVSEKEQQITMIIITSVVTRIEFIDFCCKYKVFVGRIESIIQSILE